MKKLIPLALILFPLTVAAAPGVYTNFLVGVPQYLIDEESPAMVTIIRLYCGAASREYTVVNEIPVGPDVEDFTIAIRDVIPTDVSARYYCAATALNIVQEPDGEAEYESDYSGEVDFFWMAGRAVHSATPMAPGLALQ